MRTTSGPRPGPVRSWGTVAAAMASSVVFVVGVLGGYAPFTAFRPTASVVPLGGNPGCPELGISGNAEWDRYSVAEYREATQASRDLGAGRVRIGANWSEIERTQGHSDWSALDQRVRSAQDAGLRPLLVLQTLPSWIAIPSGPVSGEHHRVAGLFADFARSVAARYGRVVDGYEIWNEPNLSKFWPDPDVGSYTILLKAAYPAIHGADPGATVITAGLAPAPDSARTIAPLTFLRGLYAHGGHGFFDAVGMHPYSYPEMPSGTSTWNTFRSLGDVKRLMTEHGDGGKRIWLTEYGAPTGGGKAVSPETQAAMFVEAYRLAKADPSLGPIFMYTLIDGGAPQYDTEFHFGLYYADRTPKPAVRALQDAVVDCTAESADGGSVSTSPPFVQGDPVVPGTPTLDGTRLLQVGPTGSGS